METKLLMIVDDATEMPAMASRRIANVWDAGPEEVMARAGFGHGIQQLEYVWFAPLHGNTISSDPYTWGTRTRMAAHLELLDHWDQYKSGDRLDVRACPDAMRRSMSRFGG